MIELAMVGGGALLGFVFGYAACAIYLGEKIELLEEEMHLMQDRDEKGRFVKSMRKLKRD